MSMLKYMYTRAGRRIVFVPVFIGLVVVSCSAVKLEKGYCYSVKEKFEFLDPAGQPRVLAPGDILELTGTGDEGSRFIQVKAKLKIPGEKSRASAGPGQLYTLKKNEVRNYLSIEYNYTVMGWYKRRENISRIQSIIQKSTNINIRDEAGRTALMYAAFSYSASGVALALKKNANVTAKDNTGMTSLMYAAQHNSNTGVPELLIQHGADINQKSKNGKSVLYYSTLNKNRDFYRFLLEKGARNDMECATIMGDEANVRIFLKEVKQKIREKKINYADYKSRLGRMLITAAKSGMVNLVDLYFREGADVSYRNNEKNTPIHMACLSGSIESVKALILKGARLNETNDYSVTPLMYAAMQGHKDLVMILVENGADKSIKGTKFNYRDKTAAQLAHEMGYSDIYNLLSK
ncbi:MAG: hypothetical protein GY754_18245 [bacterium]|nr:hypothetical protein [bacterium]